MPAVAVAPSPTLLSVYLRPLGSSLILPGAPSAAPNAVGDGVVRATTASAAAAQVRWINFMETRLCWGSCGDEVDWDRAQRHPAEPHLEPDDCRRHRHSRRRHRRAGLWFPLQRRWGICLGDQP